MVSSQADENTQIFWYTHPSLKYSLFNYLFCQAIHGAANFNRDGIISMQESFDFVSPKMIDKSLGLSHPQQECTNSSDLLAIISGLTNESSLPTIYTASLSGISSTKAISGGNITSAGSTAVSARGVCWGTQANPTVDLNTKTIDGTGIGTFISNIIGLVAGTTYHIRAYATNNSGTAYGEDVEFTSNISALVPTVLTTSVSVITKTSAISGGTIIADDNSTINAKGICWGTSTNPTIANSKTLDVTGTATFTSAIIGLNAGTNYHARAYATNSVGTGYGQDIAFTTLTEIVVPVLSTAMTTATSNAAATSGGNITFDGGATVTSKGVCWSESANPTTANSKTLNGAGMEAFTSSITGLAAGTTYHVRAYATNSVGTGYGQDISITTPTAAILPTLTTTNTVATSATTASSGGIITADGGAPVTFRGVCWSTDPNPTTSNAKSLDGTGTGPFQSNISGLSGSSTYHVRAYATNNLGTAYGQDITFTTLTDLVVPILTTGTTSATSETAATSGGDITFDGGAPVSSRGVCWSTNPNPTLSNSLTIDGNGTGGFTSVTSQLV
jgi:hypothetical protein